MIVIPGRPIPLKRPRLGRKIVYDSQRVDKEAARFMIRKDWNKPPISDCLSVEMLFSYASPKSWSKKKKEEAKRGLPFGGRPDVDNLVKFYLDCMSGLVFEDDKLVVDIQATKFYWHSDFTAISAVPFENFPDLALDVYSQLFRT